MKNLVKKHVLQAMAILLTVLCVPLFAASAEEEPEVAIGDTAVAVATVVSIDKETRTLTLEDEDGEQWNFAAGPEVRNFDQIKTGDRVITQFYAAFAIALGPKGSGTAGRVDEIQVERAKPGEKPAGRITHTVTAGGIVEAVDKENRMVTLKGTAQTVVLEVSEDVDLSKVKVGDEVEAAYIASYAVAVEPAPKVSGTVDIKTTSVALGVGVEWGDGKLTMYDGSTYTFNIKGMSVIEIGVATVKAEGKVYKLVEPKDLEGKYLAGEVGGALGVGVSVLTMENSNGVVLKLKSKQKGVNLTLAPEGLSITNVKRAP
jgi:Cu/Ag efflux protein CusF